MKPRRLAPVLTVLGALLWAGTARAQSQSASVGFYSAPFYCESYLIWDPIGQFASGYSRTLDYENEGYEVGVEADLYDPDYNEAYSEDMGEYEDAEADVYDDWGLLGNYWIYGDHWGVGTEEGCCEYELGETEVNVDADPLAPAGEISNWYTWSDQDDYGGGLFLMDLQGHAPNGGMAAGESYDGDSVEEYLSGYYDGCYFDGSSYPQLEMADGWGPTPWVVNSEGYGADYIGVLQSWIDYYAGFNGYCTESVTQSMYINGQEGSYASHTAGVGIIPQENEIGLAFAWRATAYGDN